MDNPIHPGCTNPSKPYGKTKAGSQIFLCPDCRKRWVANPKRPGRPRSPNPLTNAQIKARQWRRMKQRYKENNGHQSS